MPDAALAFSHYFAALPDPRANRTKKHTLHDILGLMFCAAIARFGAARLAQAVLRAGQWDPQSRYL